MKKKKYIIIKAKKEIKIPVDKLLDAIYIFCVFGIIFILFMQYFQNVVVDWQMAQGKGFFYTWEYWIRIFSLWGFYKIESWFVICFFEGYKKYLRGLK